MDIDTTLLERVGTLTLQVVLTIAPLVLCALYLRSARAYFLQRQIGMLHLRPGTKYFLAMGCIESTLLCIISIPRLIAAGIFRFHFSSLVSDALSVLSTLIIHGHIFRSMFVGRQYSRFLSGRPRCERRWRPVFAVLMGCSVILCVVRALYLILGIHFSQWFRHSTVVEAVFTETLKRNVLHDVHTFDSEDWQMNNSMRSLLCLSWYFLCFLYFVCASTNPARASFRPPLVKGNLSGQHKVLRMKFNGLQCIGSIDTLYVFSNVLHAESTRFLMIKTFLGVRGS